MARIVVEYEYRYEFELDKLKEEYADLWEEWVDDAGGEENLDDRDIEEFVFECFVYNVMGVEAFGFETIEGDVTNSRVTLD